MRLRLLFLLGLCACPGGDDTAADDTASADDSGGGTGCAASSTIAVVTDIDETLTTDDLEWIYQLADPDHDPEMRPDANTLMLGYDALGYRMIYLTARGEDLGLSDGTSGRDATTAWLDLHGFPYDPDDVFLADGYGALGGDAATYKTDTLTALQDAGVTVAWAYGNADTDITAYQAVGIADDHIFLVGDLAGDYGVEPITNDDAYTNHVADFLPTVPCAGE